MILEENTLLNLLDMDPIIVGSLALGIIIWMVFNRYSSNLSKSQNKVLALVLFILAVISLLVSIFTSLGSFGVTAFVFTGLAFLVFRKKIKDHSKYRAPILHQKEEDRQEIEKELSDKYESDMKYGIYHYGLKEYDKARNKFIHALKIDENAIDPWYYIGLINLDLERYEFAIISFKKILDSDMNHEKAKEKLEYAKSLYKLEKSNKKKKKNKK
ncbi:MAG: hypothetical protein ACTSYI_07225 [Promethearchaeota archaeon]